MIEWGHTAIGRYGPADASSSESGSSGTSSSSSSSNGGTGIAGAGAGAGAGVRVGAGAGQGAGAGAPPATLVPVLDEVSVLIWPDCKIEYFPRGTTVGDVIRQKGLIAPPLGPAGSEGEGSSGVDRRVMPPADLFSPGDLLVNVNNRCASEDWDCCGCHVVVVGAGKAVRFCCPRTRSCWGRPDNS